MRASPHVILHVWLSCESGGLISIPTGRAVRKGCHLPQVAQGQNQPWALGVLSPSPVYFPVPSRPAFGGGRGLLGVTLPPRRGGLCRHLRDDTADEGPCSWHSLMGTPHDRQALLYSQEVEEDYSPCEEDLFVL